MSPTADSQAGDMYVQTYDDSVPDWPGEIEFYRNLAAEARNRGEGLLEIACGTGRVAVRLAQDGTRTVGLDLSPKMLAEAKKKSAGIENIRWAQADMRRFDLAESFGLALIPGHSFQNLNTPQDQAACLECIRRHLLPGGRLVIHLDHQNIENVGWLGGLVGEKAGVFEAEGEIRDAHAGRVIRTLNAWTYEPATQTAVCTTAWETVGDDGKVVDRKQTESIRLHVVYRFEMEHLLARTGFEVEALYGDFFRHPLDDNSPGMVWVARKPAAVE